MQSFEYHRPASLAEAASLLAKSEGLPWWRVVGSGGRLRTPDRIRQARLLADEGVLVVDNRVATID